MTCQEEKFSRWNPRCFEDIILYSCLLPWEDRLLNIFYLDDILDFQAISTENASKNKVIAVIG